MKSTDLSNILDLIVLFYLLVLLDSMATVAMATCTCLLPLTSVPRSFCQLELDLQTPVPLNSIQFHRLGRMEGDPRRTYLLRLASAVFGLKIEEEKLKQTGPIDKFCDTNTSILVILRNEVGLDYT